MWKLPRVYKNLGSDFCEAKIDPIAKEKAKIDPIVDIGLCLRRENERKH